MAGSRAARPSKKRRKQDSCRRGCLKRFSPYAPSDVGIENGVFRNIPPEIVHHILKFLSAEDLISCAIVCKFLCCAASDDSLWRRLYSMRWNSALASSKRRSPAWKNLYIQHDREDMSEFVGNSPSEFDEYYIQMQAAKRSQAPPPSQVNDDHIVLDTTVADKDSFKDTFWRSRRAFRPEFVAGSIYTYSQIGDVCLCHRAGSINVCGDTCRESFLDEFSGFQICHICGGCLGRWISSEEEADDEEDESDEEAFLARAYERGYNCVTEDELEEALMNY